MKRSIIHDRTATTTKHEETNKGNLEEGDKPHFMVIVPCACDEEEGIISVNMNVDCTMIPTLLDTILVWGLSPTLRIVDSKDRRHGGQVYRVNMTIRGNICESHRDIVYRHFERLFNEHHVPVKW